MQVLFIDAKNAKLTRYHASRLEFLADGVVLPDWSMIGEPKVKPWAMSGVYFSGPAIFMVKQMRVLP